MHGLTAILFLCVGVMSFITHREFQAETILMFTVGGYSLFYVLYYYEYLNEKTSAKMKYTQIMVEYCIFILAIITGMFLVKTRFDFVFGTICVLIMTTVAGLTTYQYKKHKDSL